MIPVGIGLIALVILVHKGIIGWQVGRLPPRAQPLDALQLARWLQRLLRRHSGACGLHS